ncbi:MAG: excinuclease ABC subunit UvrC [Proteobacteria bacterium]|nr:excinuclease ABC subunit UvrC [Pseudomonadota bacterium]
MLTAGELEQQIKHISQDPGVYLFFDRFNRIIYIGKAIKLKNRIQSYWNESNWSNRYKLKFLVPKITKIETIVTKSEKEALILESNLVFKHQPQYNVLLKDNKTFPWLVITYDEAYPRLIPVRDIKKFKKRRDSKNKFFGPYTNSGAMYENLELVNELFPLRKKRSPPFKNRPCLNYDLGKCLGPCQKLISEEDYGNMLEQVEMLLKGNYDDLKSLLTAEMLKASDDLNFEKAAKLRDQIKSLKTFNEVQNVISVNYDLSQDIFAIAYDPDEQCDFACLQVFKIREGKLINRENHEIDFGDENDSKEIFESAFMQYYTQVADSDLPKEILLSEELNSPKEEDEVSQACQNGASPSNTLEEWLSERKGSKVTINTPKRGDKYAQVELAKRNAKLMLRKMKIDMLEDSSKDINVALDNLQKALDLKSTPSRIECFDISHIQGTNVVASMVCFIDGLPAKDQYRRFKISIDQNNDFASMQEVVKRRYKPLSKALKVEYENQAEHDTNESEAEANTGLDSSPNLIIIDGGKGQLSAAREIMKELNLSHIQIVGLAKREEEIFFPENKTPMVLDRKSPELFLIQKIRNEAHRFAIEYHRKLRARKAKESLLDSVSGLGPKKKKILLEKFGTVNRILTAPLNEIEALPGFNKLLAERVRERLIPKSV